MSKRVLKKDLEATITRLREERQELIDGLKDIALGKSLNPKQTADKALRAAGLFALKLDPDCPPDKIYWILGSAMPVNDYI